MGRHGNPYFYFQQFSIWQDRCAMKVGIDGLLLGAWASVDSAKTILDIGTGTGLIALMLAQRTPKAHIMAIEIDRDAYSQAKENIARSPWAQRIHLQNIAYQDFSPEHHYDLIVSNPPYFSNIQSSQPRNIARQQVKLSPSDIFYSIKPKLSESGRLALIFPYQQISEIIETAIVQGLSLCRRTNIRPTPTSILKRTLLEFTPQQTSKIAETELIIEIQRHQYSHQYKQLLQDFLQKFTQK